MGSENELGAQKAEQFPILEIIL